MAKRTIPKLKDYFQAGKRPTEDQFEDVFDSFIHLDNPDYIKTEDWGSTREGILKFFTYEHSATNIFHIKLPYKADTDYAMFYLKATGYNYSQGDIIDVTWVGYCYQPDGNVINHKSHVAVSATITAGQYVGSDSHVYIWLKLPNTYFSTFKIDSMHVGNGRLLKQGDLEIIVSDLNQL